MENTTTCSKDKKPFKVSRKLKVPIYGCTIEFLIVDNVAESVNKLYKKYKLKETFDGEAEGCVFSPDFTVYHIMIEKKCISHNTIAHELFHAAVKITEDREITDEEQQAWLAGWLTETMYKFLEKKNLEIK